MSASSSSTGLVCGRNSNLASNNFTTYVGGNDYIQDWKWVDPLKVHPIEYNPPVTITTTGTLLPYVTSGFLTTNNNIMQNKVAVFKVTRDENQKITSTTFIKEMWIESKNGSSIDFEVAKDPEISKYKADEITIKNVYSITF